MDPMNVDALPMDPPTDAGDEVDSVEDHLVEARFLAQLKVEAALAGGRRCSARAERPFIGGSLDG